jgi:hypothetical protein
MGVTAGPADWWVATPQSFSGLITSCPAGTILPDGSALICKAGGTAWIVAPNCTQVGQTWNNTTTNCVGNKCCVCDWPTLCSRMISCGFTPADWFVPTPAQLQNPGYVCRTQWDTFAATMYWSSTEIDATTACFVYFTNGNAGNTRFKTSNCPVRAFRCVTY